MEEVKYRGKISEERFLLAKSEAESYYSTIIKIHCPYFKESVNFNAKGLDHIKFKGWGKARNQNDQYMRLRLLPCAKEVLERSNTLQGISYSSNLERVKVNSRWEEKVKKVSYYLFFAVVRKIRIKVVVKQIEGGEKYFWSLIPFWHINEGPGRKLYEGNPEND